MCVLHPLSGAIMTPPFARARVLRAGSFMALRYARFVCLGAWSRERARVGCTVCCPQRSVQPAQRPRAGYLEVPRKWP